MVTAERLLDGASLRVVLRPDPQVHVTFPDLIESFSLPHVVIDGDKFIGKSRGHGLPYNYREEKIFDPSFACSYAYANYADMVVNCSVARNFIRLHDARAYRELAFSAVTNFETVWEHGRDTSVTPVEKAIRHGRALRIALHDSEGFWNIHPVDMSSFYIGRDFFELFTEQDSIPLLFRYPQTLGALMNERFQQIAAADLDPSGEVARALAYKVGMPEFYSTYYTIRSNGEYLRGAYVDVEETPLRYVALKVFAEKV